MKKNHTIEWRDIAQVYTFTLASHADAGRGSKRLLMNATPGSPSSYQITKDGLDVFKTGDIHKAIEVYNETVL